MLPRSKLLGNLDVGDEEEVEHSAVNRRVVGSRLVWGASSFPTNSPFFRLTRCHRERIGCLMMFPRRMWHSCLHGYGSLVWETLDRHTCGCLPACLTTILAT